MRRFRSLLVSMGAATLMATLATAGMGPTRVSPGYADSGPQTRSVAYDSPASVHPIAAPYGSPNYVATPEIISRVGEILGAIDSPQRRTELAEQWLRYSKEVIARDLDYREQWLDLQRQQLSQQQEMAQLRLEVARLQVQVEELRARNAQLERQNLRTPARLGPGFDEPSSAPAPQAPALK